MFFYLFTSSEVTTVAFLLRNVFIYVALVLIAIGALKFLLVIMMMKKRPNDSLL